MSNVLLKISYTYITLSRAEATSCFYFHTTCEAWRTLGSPQEAVTTEAARAGIWPLSLAAEVTSAVSNQSPFGCS